MALGVSEIVSNAVIHGEGSVIEFTSRLHEGQLELYIRDHGPGLQPRNGKHGMGMGLAIAAEVCEEIVVRSSRHHGTGVTLVFPCPAIGLRPIEAAS